MWKTDKERETKNDWMEKLIMLITTQGSIDKFQDFGLTARYILKRDGYY